MSKSIELEDKVIEVFKTTLDTSQAAFQISRMLEASFPGCKINFDLEDCDRILRIEAQNAMDINAIIALGLQLGVTIELLED